MSLRTGTNLFGFTGSGGAHARLRTAGCGAPPSPPPPPPPAGWWWGANGQSCDSVCDAVGLPCNAAAMETATTLADLLWILDNANTQFAGPVSGVTMLGGNHPTEVAPFWDGRHAAYVFPPYGTVMCSAGHNKRYRLCRCGDTSPPSPPPSPLLPSPPPVPPYAGIYFVEEAMASRAAAKAACEARNGRLAVIDSAAKQTEAVNARAAG